MRLIHKIVVRQLIYNFNEYFLSVFTLSENNTVPQFHLIVYNKPISLKTNKSPGPDGFPILALRETALKISVPLAITFKKFLEKRITPDSWSYITCS